MKFVKPLDLAVWAIVGLLACRGPETRELLFSEGFEELCDGAPCGWTQVAGASEDVRFIATIHPGEHGFSLRGDSALRFDAMVPPAPLTITMGAIEVAASARCDAGGRIEVEAGVVDGFTGTADTFRGVLLPPTDWGATAFTPLVGDDALSPDGGLGGGSLGTVVVDNARLLALTLRHLGSGACEIDHITLDGVGLATETPSSCSAD